MTSRLLLNDIMVWSLQIVLLIAAGAALPALLGLRVPKVRLAYWQLVLVACLLLPAVRSWKPDVIGGTVSVSTTIVSLAPTTSGKNPVPFSAPMVLLIVIAAGVLVRFGFLLSGMWRLRCYRLESRPLEPPSPWGVEANLRISEEIAGPVTFGFRKPIVLLPVRFLSLDEAMQDAILCHEILHVRRRDWLFASGEELVRALFWFHPAIWWLLREIQLVREQAVDREAVEMTHSRDRYIDALLVIAGAPGTDLAPAPLFLRKRHLKQRVASILKEVRMSTTKSLSALGASLTLLAASCWFITGVLPLHAAPQTVFDPAGVSVDIGGADLFHRDPVTYPREAIEKGVQGTVVARVKLDPAGNVTDAAIVSGPEELRKAVLQSVLGWHFAPTAAAAGTREISVAFALPAPAAPIARVPGPALLRAVSNQPIESIRIDGLSDPARQQLQGQLPVHEGDTLTADNYAQLVRTVQAFDSHLQAGRIPTLGGGVVVVISRSRESSAAVTVRPPAPPPPGSVRIGGNLQATKLITQVKPVYPPLAKAAHVQGLVEFQATIGTDGTVQNLQLLTGPPLLVQAAMEAVQQWVYEPAVQNGSPMTVVTRIDVNFTLAE